VKEVIGFIESIFSLSSEQQVFILAIMAMLVTGFALFVVLAALRNISNKRGSE